MANWFKTAGSATAGDGSTPPTPGDITFGTVIRRNTGTEVQITIAYEPPDPLSDFVGFYPFLQRGDFLTSEDNPGAAIPEQTVEGGWIVGPPDVASPLVPPPSNEPLPFVPYDPQNKILSFTRPFPTDLETWIVYGVARTKLVTNQLRTLDMPEPHSPSTVFQLQPRNFHPPDSPTGAEVAPLALSFTLRSPGVKYSLQDGGSYVWTITVDWTDAVLDPRYADLGGYDLLYQNPDLTFSSLGLPSADPSGAGSFTTAPQPLPTVPTDLRIYLVSWRGSDGAENSIPAVNPPTPFIDIHLEKPLGGAGSEFTSLVTGFTVETPGYVYDATGQVAYYPIKIKFTPPDDPTFAGVIGHIVRADGSDTPFSGLLYDPEYLYEWTYFLEVDEPVTIYLLSVSTAGANSINSYVPSLTPAQSFVIPPPGAAGSGVEYCANVTPGSPMVALGVALPQADGTYVEPCTVNATPPTDTKWGGADIVVKYADGSLTTWATNVSHFPHSFNFKPTASVQNATFYLVSRSVNNKRNSIVDGITPAQVVSQGTGAGQLDFAKALGASLATYFDVVGGQLVIKDQGINAAKIADFTITNQELATAAVTTRALAGLSVDNTKLAALAVDAAKLADSAVTATKIANLAVGSAAIAALAVGSAQIANAAIISTKIGTAAILSAHIADAQILNAHIVALAATKITAGTLAAGVIYGGTINAGQINAGTLNAVSMNGGTLTLNLSGITTTIANVFTAGSIGDNVGLKMQNNSSLFLSALRATALNMLDGGGNGVVNLNSIGGTGQLLLTNPSQPGVSVGVRATADPTFEILNSLSQDMKLTAHSLAFTNLGGHFVGSFATSASDPPGAGVINLADGTGSGSLDGHGTKIIMSGQTGVIQCNQLNIAGNAGQTSSVQVSTPTGSPPTVTLHFTGGAFTGFSFP